MDKQQVTPESKRVKEHESDSEDAGSIASPVWRPGYGQRFPMFGVGALLAVLACTGASVGVLVGSNNVSSSNWIQALAPNVCLQAINAVSNIMLAFAIAQGIAIAWWRKALRGATIAELHKSWEFSMSIGNIAFNLFSLDVIALAALATKVAIIDGVLFQRATSTYTSQDPPVSLNTISIAATTFPSTGYIVSDTSFGAQASCGCFMIGDAFTPVVNEWETSNGFFKDYNDWFRINTPRSQQCSGLCPAKIEYWLRGKSRSQQHCDGTCYASLDAIGFEIDCEQEMTHENIAEAPIAAYIAAENGTSGDSSAWSDVAIFNSSFALQYAQTTSDTSAIDLDLTYFQADDPYNPSNSSCAGRVFTAKCKLRPAIVSYPVKIVNYTNPLVINGVSLTSRPSLWSVDEKRVTPVYSRVSRQAEGFTVGRRLNVSDTHTYGGLTALGGMANAMQQFLGSTASLTYHGEAQSESVWALKQVGILAQTMMYGPPNMGSCDCSFRSASLDAIIQKINELAFLTAVGMIDHKDFAQRRVHDGDSATLFAVGQNSTAAFRPLNSTAQVSDVVFYKTHYWFMLGGIIVSFACVLLVLPTFWRYGELGRNVTLGPIEVASAFRAPMLTEGRQTAAEAGGDIHELIRDVGHKKVQYGFLEDTSPADVVNRRQSVRLAMAEPHKVRPASGVWSPPMSPSLESPTSPRFAKVEE